MTSILIKNRTSDFIPKEFITDGVHNEDKNYLNFLKTYNGGYFFNNSLHIFGRSEKNPHHDYYYVNNLYRISYGQLIKGVFFFAEDIFGNPFGFINQKIIHFNLETAEKEIISDDFLGWLREINKDLDYYTGKSLVLDLKAEDRYQLAYGKRLGAKYPFVLGGEYINDNLVLKDFEDNIDYNSSIAKQIINLPDGSKINLDFKGKIEMQ